MLAEKYSYMEATSAPVLEPEITQIPERQTEPRIREREVPQKRPAGRSQALNKFLTISLVLICFAAACFIVYRYALISENHRAILALEKELEKANTLKKNLEVELAFRKDLRQIEFAATEMGMDYPQEDQVKYVEVPKREKQTEHAEADYGQLEKSFWKRFLGLSN